MSGPPTVVLALCSAARDGGAPAAAVARARDLGAELHALYVIDARTIDDLERRVSGQGFVGERPCADLMNAAVEEWRRCADAALADVRAAAEEAGVACTIEVRDGDWADQSAAVVDRLEVERGPVAECVAPDFADSALRRLLRSDDLARLRARVGCPVTSAP